MIERTPLAKPNVNEVMEDLDIRMERIMRLLKPEIEKGSYGLILGVDASGRVPTLVIDRIIKKVYAKNGRTIETRFIAGSKGILMDEKRRGQKLSYLQEYLADLPLDKSKKVLIVDDTIASGTSIDPILVHYLPLNKEEILCTRELNTLRTSESCVLTGAFELSGHALLQFDAVYGPLSSATQRPG